jgi:hypothetical protein
MRQLASYVTAPCKKAIGAVTGVKSARRMLQTATANAAGGWYHGIKYDPKIASVCCWKKKYII